MRLLAEFQNARYDKYEIVEEELHNLTDNVKFKGYYLYIYDGEIIKFDYLQDTLYFAKEQAFEDFGVPMEAWREVGDK